MQQIILFKKRQSLDNLKKILQKQHQITGLMLDLQLKGLLDKKMIENAMILFIFNSSKLLQSELGYENEHISNLISIDKI